MKKKPIEELYLMLRPVGSIGRGGMVVEKTFYSSCGGESGTGSVLFKYLVAEVLG
jgi:hypothetical protein